MSIAITQTIHVLQLIVQAAPIGTNLALLQLMWTIINGSFLQCRGAIFPALQANGFTPKESYRIWGAFRHGVWRCDKLINRWRSHVLGEGQWVSRSYEGYRPVAVDWTAIWRFKLQGWSGKLFNGLLGKVVRGVGSYRLRIFLKMPFLTLNFAKRHPLQTICPKGWRLIVVKRCRLNGSHQFNTVFQPIF